MSIVPATNDAVEATVAMRSKDKDRDEESSHVIMSLGSFSAAMVERIFRRRERMCLRLGDSAVQKIMLSVCSLRLDSAAAKGPGQWCALFISVLRQLDKDTQDEFKPAGFRRKAYDKLILLVHKQDQAYQAYLRQRRQESESQRRRQDEQLEREEGELLDQDNGQQQQANIQEADKQAESNKEIVVLTDATNAAAENQMVPAAKTTTAQTVTQNNVNRSPSVNEVGSLQAKAAPVMPQRLQPTGRGRGRTIPAWMSKQQHLVTNSAPRTTTEPSRSEETTAAAAVTAAIGATVGRLKRKQAESQNDSQVSRKKAAVETNAANNPVSGQPTLATAAPGPPPIPNSSPLASRGTVAESLNNTATQSDAYRARDNVATVSLMKAPIIGTGQALQSVDPAISSTSWRNVRQMSGSSLTAAASFSNSIVGGQTHTLAPTAVDFSGSRSSGTAVPATAFAERASATNQPATSGRNSSSEPVRAPELRWGSGWTRQPPSSLDHQSSRSESQDGSLSQIRDLGPSPSQDSASGAVAFWNSSSGTARAPAFPWGASWTTQTLGSLDRQSSRPESQDGSLPQNRGFGPSLWNSSSESTRAPASRRGFGWTTQAPSSLDPVSQERGEQNRSLRGRSPSQESAGGTVAFFNNPATLSDDRRASISRGREHTIPECTLQQQFMANSAPRTTTELSQSEETTAPATATTAIGATTERLKRKQTESQNDSQVASKKAVVEPNVANNPVSGQPTSATAVSGTAVPATASAGRASTTNQPLVSCENSSLEPARAPTSQLGFNWTRQAQGSLDCQAFRSESQDRSASQDREAQNYSHRRSPSQESSGGSHLDNFKVIKASDFHRVLDKSLANVPSHLSQFVPKLGKNGRPGGNLPREKSKFLNFLAAGGSQETRERASEFWAWFTKENSKELLQLKQKALVPVLDPESSDTSSGRPAKKSKATASDRYDPTAIVCPNPGGKNQDNTTEKNAARMRAHTGVGSMSVVSEAEPSQRAPVYSPDLDDLKLVPFKDFHRLLHESIDHVPKYLDYLVPKLLVRQGNKTKTVVNIPREKNRFLNFMCEKSNLRSDRKRAGEFWEWFGMRHAAELLRIKKERGATIFFDPLADPVASQERSTTSERGAAISQATTEQANNISQGVRSGVTGAQENFSFLNHNTSCVVVKFGPEDNNSPFASFEPKYRTSPRSELTVGFKGGGMSLEKFEKVFQRVRKWEPFWFLDWVVQMGDTHATDSQDPAAKTAVQLDVHIAIRKWTENGKIAADRVVWGSSPQKNPTNGTTRLILMALPDCPARMKRADVHQWPKGTFVQLDMGPGKKFPIRIIQRKQQSHDAQEWKTLSRMVDLTQYVQDPTNPFKVEALCHDPNPFTFVLGLFRWRDKELIVESLQSGSHLESIQTLSREEATAKALTFTRNSILVLGGDSDDEGEGSANPGEEDAGKMIFSLKDSFTKRLFETPVRGKMCLHFQCFDLLPFLAGNSFPSGQRWRCPVCEKFVACGDLEMCGLTKALVQEFRDIATANRDRVEFRSDTTYVLLDERRKKYGSDTGNSKNIPKSEPRQLSSSSEKAAPTGLNKNDNKNIVIENGTNKIGDKENGQGTLKSKAQQLGANMGKASSASSLSEKKKNNEIVIDEGDDEVEIIEIE